MRRLRMWWRGWRYHRGWRPAIVEQPPEQDFYGSMDLESERALYWPAPTRWEVAHEDSGWREQTAAALSPEALDEEENPWPGLAFMTAGLIVADAITNLDSRPGAGSSLAPGPEPAPPWDWETELTEAWVRDGMRVFWLQPEPAPDPQPELGPNAARVLARWERRRRERWRLDWDNEAVA